MPFSANAGCVSLYPGFHFGVHRALSQINSGAGDPWSRDAQTVLTATLWRQKKGANGDSDET
ncbi:MAG: hypothetical protein NVS9B4_14550 [Candidatus Acidiferrum sp.]